MTSKPSPALIFPVRLAAGLFAGVGLGCYILVVKKVFDFRFPAQNKYFSVLPIGGAAYSIIWNIFALMTFFHLRSIYHSFGDVIAAITVLALGAVGLEYDSRTYLRNGMYKMYDNGTWLPQEITGGSTLLVSVLLQLLLAILMIFAQKKRRCVAQSLEAPSHIYIKPTDINYHATDMSEDKGYILAKAKSISSFESDFTLENKSTK